MSARPRSASSRWVRAVAAALVVMHVVRGTCPAQAAPNRALAASWRDVEVIRSAHGVPHIRAVNLRAAGYALAWMQLEDYGPRTAMNVLRGSGRMARVFGRDSIEADFNSRRPRAVATWHLLEQATRDMYSGFADGVNRYVVLHREEFAERMPHDFTGYDVAALDVGALPAGKMRAFAARLARTPGADAPPDGAEGDAATHPDEGSNAWALAPSRTTSGRAILLRNPHLAWTAGYYEAHVTVPGQLDFYGDFRIGGPFAVVGGFNRDLGWATTNNAQDLDEVYALDADSARSNHYLLDGASLPLSRDVVTVEFRNGDAVSTETRERWSSPFGPVIHRSDRQIYVMKAANDGEFRSGEQFLRMMRASSLKQWKDAMRLRARPTSNFTYADRAGNIFYIWNAALPLLPHPPGRDSIAFPARSATDMWTRYVPFDMLPQLLNPRGGYIHNENSSHHFSNLRVPFDTINPYPNLEAPSFSLRSQLGAELIGGRGKLSLEDVVRLKHSYRMLLADRVKNDLIAAVRATRPTGEIAGAISLIARWRNDAAPESRGAVLFEAWWLRYAQGLPDSQRFATTWSAADPARTPRGLANAPRAAEAFAWAVTETAKRHGRWDIAWGDVYRVRRGTVDLPVGGCSGAFGCFRTLGFTRDNDGRSSATVGDGWVLAVEFGAVPRAYSILAYGQSSRVESPWHADQAAMFARGEMKRVVFTSADVDAAAVMRFRPGEARTATR